MRLIPGFSVTLMFTDARGELVHLYDENTAATEVAPLYISEFYNNREAEHLEYAFTDAFRHGFMGANLETIITVDRSTWERGDTYNLILRPLGYCGGLRVAVRDGQRPLAMIAISRDIGTPEFNARDLDLLIALEPYFAHAFQGDAGGAPYVESDAEEDQGLIVADREGRLLYLSRSASVLLFYATHPEVRPGTLRLRERPVLPPPVARLARMLAQTFERQAPSLPPVHRHENAWGRFVFRAYWLKSQAASSPLVAIHVKRLEPLPVRVLRRMEHLPLSERQVEVSLHLSAGLTYAAIAERLGVSRTTAIFHAQQVFNKLGVSGRAELQAKLMAL